MKTLAEINKRARDHAYTLQDPAERAGALGAIFHIICWQCQSQDEDFDADAFMRDCGIEEDWLRERIARL